MLYNGTTMTAAAAAAAAAQSPKIILKSAPDVADTDLIDHAIRMMGSTPNQGLSQFHNTTKIINISNPPLTSNLKPSLRHHPPTSSPPNLHQRRITSGSIYSADSLVPTHSSKLRFGSISGSGIVSVDSNDSELLEHNNNNNETRDKFQESWDDDNPFVKRTATFGSTRSASSGHHRQSIIYGQQYPTTAQQQALNRRSNSIHVSKLSTGGASSNVMSTYQLSTETALAFSRALNSKTAPIISHRRTTIHRFMSTTASELDQLIGFETKSSWLTSLYTKLPKSKKFCRLQLKLLNLSVFDSVGRALEETANGDHAMLEHNSFLFALFNQFVPHDRIPLDTLSKYVYRLHKYDILATIEFNLLKTPQSGQCSTNNNNNNNSQPKTKAKSKNNGNGNGNGNSDGQNCSQNCENSNVHGQSMEKSGLLFRHRRSESISNTTTRHANKRENLHKNQNPKFVPFDYNRVILQNDNSGIVYGPTKFTLTSDYINASHVDSLLNPNAYIVAQGPTEATVGEFWQMIWQQNVHVILMLTKVYEFIRVMCVQYWPSAMNIPEIFSTASTAGDDSGHHQYEVTLVDEDKLADYIVRTMKVRQIRPQTTNFTTATTNNKSANQNFPKKSSKLSRKISKKSRLSSLLNEPGPSDISSIATTSCGSPIALDDDQDVEDEEEDDDEDSGEYRTIYQLHFLSWNINSCPYSDSILKFRRRVQHYQQLCRSNCKPDRVVVGPLLIHCSNGCGRSGTYACLDANLQLADEEGVVDIFNYAKSLRKARANMIENLEQYKFVYETIEESFVCGKTWFHLSEISQQMKQKAIKNKVTKRNEYQDEFEKLMSMTSKFSIGDCAGGHRLENRYKNRDVSIVPPDDFRPYLTSFQCNDQTDYINAVFVDGYARPREYIVTEWPLKKTIPDIWSLIYDHDCNTVVVLGGVPDNNNKSFPTFWPKDCAETTRYGPTFSVDTISYNHPPQINTWVYRVQKKVTSLTELMAGIKAEPKITQVFEFLAWPYDYKVPTSTNALVELIHMVERWRQRTSYGPVLVVSANGKSRVGVYCAANFAIEQVVAHEDIDIFNAVKTVRRHRSALIETIMEYKYCYDLTLHYVSHYLKKGNYNQIFKKQ